MRAPPGAARLPVILPQINNLKQDYQRNNFQAAKGRTGASPALPCDVQAGERGGAASFLAARLRRESFGSAIKGR